MAAISGHQSGFEGDVAAYLSALPVELSRNEGKFALIGQQRLVGIFATKDQAMAAGYQKFGIAGFLVQQITQFDMDMGQHWLDSCQP